MMKQIFPLSAAVGHCLFFLLAPPLRADDTAPATPPNAPTGDVAPADDAAPPQEPTRDTPVDQTTLDAAIAEVQDTVEMSAPMELEYEAGVDPVVEAYDLGVIVDVTLEQVEAALAAAALTPEIEDDQAALELKHRGTYRFFCGEVTLQPPPPTDPPATEPDPDANPNN